MTEMNVLEKAPAMFQKEKLPTLSPRYKTITTGDFIQDMKDLGWYPVAASQTKVRNQARQGFQRHLVSFENDSVTLKGHSDIKPRIIVINSNDGTTSFKFFFGVFRFVCSNGLIVCDEFVSGMKIVHKHYTAEEVHTMVLEYIQKIPAIGKKIERYKSITLSKRDRLAFAETALKIRYGEKDSYPIDAESLLEVKREEDQGDDLFTIMNVIQEKLMMGGVRGVSTTGRKMTTRTLKAISKVEHINTALWAAMDAIAQKKFK